MISDTFPSKMDCSLFQEYTTTKLSLLTVSTEKLVDVMNDSIKRTCSLLRDVKDWMRTRQLRV